MPESKHVCFCLSYCLCHLFLHIVTLPFLGFPLPGYRRYCWHPCWCVSGVQFGIAATGGVSFLETVLDTLAR